MTKKWDKHRDVIVRLYKEQNLPLHEVRKILEDKHQFKASIRAFRTRLDKWGISKYNCQRRSSASSNNWAVHSPGEASQPTSPTLLYGGYNTVYPSRPGYSQEAPGPVDNYAPDLHERQGHRPSFGPGAAQADIYRGYSSGYLEGGHQVNYFADPMTSPEQPLSSAYGDHRIPLKYESATWQS